MSNLATKIKGDVGLTQVIADLTKRGINVALPIAEHLPYDIIAISEQHVTIKISVKYVGAKHGAIPIPLRSVSTNMKGWKAKTIDFSVIDGFAVYCPDSQAVYYLPVAAVKGHKSTFALRTDTPKRKGDYRLAVDFQNPHVLWETQAQ